MMSADRISFFLAPLEGFLGMDSSGFGSAKKMNSRRDPVTKLEARWEGR